MKRKLLVHDALVSFHRVLLVVWEDTAIADGDDGKGLELPCAITRVHKVCPESLRRQIPTTAPHVSLAPAACTIHLTVGRYTLKLLQKKLILTVPVSLANGQTSKEVNSFDRPQTTNTDTDTDNTGDPTTFAYCRWG